jgi:hypothetical protein
MLAALLPATVLALSACQSSSSSQSGANAGGANAADHPSSGTESPGRAQITEEYTATAQVVSIDKADRSVTLRREDGSMVGVHVGEDVRNFDQIVPGDVLKLHYKESLMATKLSATESTRPVEGAFAAGRAKPGAKPAGALGVAASTRVKIESIDREKHIVVFSRASGELVSHRVETPEGREFVEGLVPGDIVQLDGAQALALSIEKP